MDIDVARQMVRVAFKNSADLSDLMIVLKDRCGADEYRQLALGIAEAIDRIGVALTNKALAAYPHLADEIEKTLADNGRY